jgi:hypothetical protein
MRKNIVLLDFENVQPDSLEKLAHDHFRVIMFVGANQKRLDIELVKAMQALGNNGEYIQIMGNGPNALDFHISFYIGKFSEAYRDSYFHIISKDKGFVPLVAHLKENHIFCSRWDSVGDIPFIRLANKMAPDDRAKEFYEKKLRISKGRPATVKSLHNSINGHFLKLLAENELEKIVEALKTSGKIKIEGNKVKYENCC